MKSSQAGWNTQLSDQFRLSAMNENKEGNFFRTPALKKHVRALAEKLGVIGQSGGVLDSETGEKISEERWNQYCNQIFKFCCEEPFSLKDLDSFFRGNSGFIQAVCKVQPRALLYATEELRNDEQLILHLIPEVPESFRYAGDLVRQNKELAIQLIQLKPEVYRYLSDFLKNDYQVSLSAIRQNGLLLEFSSENLKRNPIIAVAAFSQNSESCIFWHTDLQQTPLLKLLREGSVSEMEMMVMQELCGLIGNQKDNLGLGDFSNLSQGIQSLMEVNQGVDWNAALTLDEIFSVKNSMTKFVELVDEDVQEEDVWIDSELMFNASDDVEGSHLLLKSELAHDH